MKVRKKLYKHFCYVLLLVFIIVTFYQHCDRIIVNEYDGMSAKGEGRNHVCAEIVGDMVKIQPNKTAGLDISFDKEPTQVAIFLNDRSVF